ncbi:MAG: hypothetical protein GY795_46225 [Desulfobacterales bacterium]|nr:hypothetical protein [Desulfobacterales bacterium]
MITLVTGKPGSGKSFLSVWLMSRYYNCDKDGWYLKGIHSGKLIITNIKGFSLPDSLSLDELIEASGGREKFFEYNNMKLLTEALKKKYNKKRIIIAVDECQRFFPNSFRNVEGIYYFDYHRHIGHSIYLITQHKNKIAMGIRVLADREFSAKNPNMFLTKNKFRYDILESGTVFQSKTIGIDPEIFNLYKSTEFDDDDYNEERYTPRIYYWFIGIIIFVAILGIKILYNMNSGDFLFAKTGTEKQQVSDRNAVMKKQQAESRKKTTTEEQQVYKEKTAEGEASKECKYVMTRVPYYQIADGKPIFFNGGVFIGEGALDFKITRLRSPYDNEINYYKRELRCISEDSPDKSERNKISRFSIPEQTIE